MSRINGPRLQLAGWLIIASLAVIVVSVFAFGSTALRTPEFNQLATVAEVADYVARTGTTWMALGVGLWLGTSLALAGLAVIALALLGTSAAGYGLLSP